MTDLRLDCEFDNELGSATGGGAGTNSNTSTLPGLVTSPGSVGGGDVPTGQRMDRFELRYFL
jgi:hypothetical protein